MLQDDPMTFENENNLPERLLQPYNPATTEAEIYKKWEESGFFLIQIFVLEKGITETRRKTIHHHDASPKCDRYFTHGTCPYGNHRRHHDYVSSRMQGYKTLWLPGTDHAGSATKLK
jgi:hypothetical protein